MSFSPGSIIKISLYDFMSFKCGTFDFAPTLNLLVGSNGAGKSSVACAIVLGLAGKVRNLERASSLNEFIRRGSHQGQIEIELFHPQGNIIIQRTISSDNKNTWCINGSSVTQKQIEGKMKELSIQVDNLCQFLPQDKVHDFAKMSKQELLLNTQNSVGSPFLTEIFQQLIEIRKCDMTSEAQLKELNNRLIALSQKHDRLAKSFERVKEKKKMSVEINMLQKKRAWLKFEVKKREFEEQERVKKEKEKELKQIKLTAKPFQDEINKISKIIKTLEEQIARFKIDENLNHGEFKKSVFSAKHWQSKIDVYKEEFEDKIAEKKRNDQQIKEIEHKLAEVESNLNDDREQELAVQFKDIKRKIDEVDVEFNRLNDSEYRTKHDIQLKETEVNNIQKKIKEANDVEEKKTQFLRNRYQSAYEIREFIQKNSQLFIGKIYGPVFMELKVESLAFARYVEAVVSGRDMVAFICEDNEDLSKLVRICKSKHLSLNAFAPQKIPSKSSLKEMYKPKFSLDYIRNFNFDYYMLDKIDAPLPVLNYLCKNYRIHEIPIGSAKVNDCLHIIPKEIWKFFSDTQQFTMTFSRYTNERSSRSVFVSERLRFLLYSVAKPDEQLLIKLQERNGDLKIVLQHLALLTNQKAKKDQEKNNLFEEKKKLLGIDEQIKYLKIKRQNYKRDLQMIHSKQINIKEEEQKKNLNIRDAVYKSTNDIKKSMQFLEKFQKIVVKCKILSLELDITIRQLTKKEGDFCDIKRRVEVVEAELDAYQRGCLQLSEEVRQLRTAAMKVTNNLSDTDSAFSRQYGRVFKELPNNIAELEDKISEIKARADCLMGADEQVEEEFKQAVKELQNLKDVISAKTADRTLKSNKIKELKNKWLPEINNLVEKINRKFSYFFQRMNCVGEVSLCHGNDEEDFSQYGLSIRVKFRDSDSLQELDRYSQSGGERSVTIAVYMLSLQDLTRVPFRCVDEINQGMDETNEMRIYHLLMESIKESNVSQYLLITPKLLKGIEYSESVRIHTIYCGEQCTPNELSKYVPTFLKSISNVRTKKRRRAHVSESESDSD